MSGQDKYLNQLEKLNKLPQTLRPVYREKQRKIRKALQKYPPPPPNSTYRRTEKLKRSWRESAVTFTRGSISAMVYSDGSARTKRGPYERWVMDANQQARVHRGRWHTTKSVEEQFEPEVIRDTNKAIQEAIR